MRTAASISHELVKRLIELVTTPQVSLYAPGTGTEITAAPPKNVKNSRFRMLPSKTASSIVPARISVPEGVRRLVGRCPLWVNNCRASSEVARPLYPQKLPRHSFAVAAVKGHNRTHALQQIAAYSITSSALASREGGMVNPSAFAVFRLMTSSYFVGACTGRSAGLPE